MVRARVQRLALVWSATIALVLGAVGCRDAPRQVAPSETVRAVEASPVERDVSEAKPVASRVLHRLSAGAAASFVAHHAAPERVLRGTVDAGREPVTRGVAFVVDHDSRLVDHAPIQHGRYLLELPGDFAGGAMMVVMHEPVLGGLEAQVGADVSTLDFALPHDDITTVEIEVVVHPRVTYDNLVMWLSAGSYPSDKRLLKARQYTRDLSEATRLMLFPAPLRRVIRTQKTTLNVSVITARNYNPDQPGNVVPGSVRVFRINDGERDRVGALESPSFEARELEHLVVYVCPHSDYFCDDIAPP